MRWTTVLFLTVLGLAGVVNAVADEPGFARAGRVQRPPALRPSAMATVPDENSDADRIDHLRKAAEHLQAAGLISLADHIRGLSRAPISAGSSKDMRLEKAPAQILLHIKLLELEEGGSRRVGLDFSRSQLLQGLSGPDRLVEALCKEGLARVLAEPTLVTVVGRPAHFRSGGEILLWDIGPDGEPFERLEHYGTRVDIVSTIAEDRCLQLEIRFEHAEVDDTKTVVVAGQENPVIRKRVVETKLEMELGQTFVISGLGAAGHGATDTASRGMVTLVTAEAVESMAAVEPSGHFRGQ